VLLHVLILPVPLRLANFMSAAKLRQNPIDAGGRNQTPKMFKDKILQECVEQAYEEVHLGRTNDLVERDCVLAEIVDLLAPGDVCVARSRAYCQIPEHFMCMAWAGKPHSRLLTCPKNAARQCPRERPGVAARD
jgi:hypothetical protein